MLITASSFESTSYLNLLFNLPLQLLDLLCEGLLASGQLRDESFLLLNLTAKLTWGTSCGVQWVRCCALLLIPERLFSEKI